MIQRMELHPPSLQERPPPVSYTHLDVYKRQVITSHHPKIINQISNKKWKIIERDIATVKNFTAEEYGIMHSQHDEYFNLINRF